MRVMLHIADVLDKLLGSSDLLAFPSEVLQKNYAPLLKMLYVSTLSDALYSCTGEPARIAALTSQHIARCPCIL